MITRLFWLVHMAKNCGIYLIVAPNGRVYIGSSKNLIKRQKQHFYKLRNNKHHCQALQNAWNKYGELIKFVVIQYCQEIELIENEQNWINISDKIWGKRLFNGSMIAGRIEMNEETRKKMSEKARSKPPVSDETRRKLSEAGKGRKLSENHLNKLKSKKLTDEHKLIISNTHKNKVISKETREKLSNSIKGRQFQTIESKLKISEALRNRPPISDETRRKLQESAKRREEAMRLKRLALSQLDG